MPRYEIPSARRTPAWKPTLALPRFTKVTPDQAPLRSWVMITPWPARPPITNPALKENACAVIGRLRQSRYSPAASPVLAPLDKKLRAGVLARCPSARDRGVACPTVAAALAE